MIFLLKDITGGKGPNVILEMLASTNLQKDMDMIAERGRIAVSYRFSRVNFKKNLELHILTCLLSLREDKLTYCIFLEKAIHDFEASF